MPGVFRSDGTAKDTIVITTVGRGDGTGVGGLTASRAQVTGISVISPRKTQVRDSVVYVDENTASPSQNVWARHGEGSEWTHGAGQWSWRWGGIPSTAVTRTATVTYTQSPPTANVSQPLSPSPTASRTRTEGIEIGGLAAAGIGIGAGIGLLGIGIVVIYICMKPSRRRKHRSSPRKVSGEDEIADDIIWPSYPYPASNKESPVELPAIRQPEEMPADTNPQEKDASSRSIIAGLDRESPIIRGARLLHINRSEGIVKIGCQDC
ncbi:hypothetical protein F5Y10DRAFT_237471 [Nemania abortiva]|nr:hypothetical protein F5Y10DRAFT_237471 [Nemania abortiva]